MMSSLPQVFALRCCERLETDQSELFLFATTAIRSTPVERQTKPNQTIEILRRTPEARRFCLVSLPEDCLGRKTGFRTDFVSNPAAVIF
jgi:hypothetical protein